jgi:DNA repair protein RAD50
MASIQKLLIRGIRSFDPQQEQVIDFQSPLTLIVGHNGAGKTTIIECLKYVTTGDLPPNSKSGAFVFDPKLANENEVKAQVRIKFLNVNGAELVCTRSLSLTQLQNKVSMKTLESLLLLTIRDTQYSISSKCAEIDKEIPNHLGVSRAILENVVFCHQEESLWPLAEPLVLKKKFDEIFAATRYTKALDNIKSLRKQLAIQLKTDASVLVKEKENKTRALKLRTELTRTRDEADRLQQRLQVLDGGEIEDRRREITNIQNKIEQFQLERELIMKNCKGLENTVKLIDLSDSELNMMLQKHIASVNSQGNEKATLEKEKITLNQNSATIQRELSEHHSKRGKYIAEDQAHEMQKTECTKAALEMIKMYKLAGFDISNFSNEQVPRLVARLDQELSSKNFESKQYRSTMKEQENVLRNDLQALKSQISGIEETRKMTQNQIVR